MKEIANRLYQYQSALHGLLAKPRRAYTARTFHELRVTIKRIKALFDLISYCSKDFDRKKAFKPFKLIFQQAGKVREFDIEQKILQQYLVKGSLPQYHARLVKSRLRQRQIFFAMINNQSIKRLRFNKKKLARYASAVDKAGVRRYVQQNEQSMKDLLSHGIIQNEQLHEFRKRLKTLNYNKKTVARYLKDTGVPKKDKLPDLLGKWHDCHVIITHLKKALDKGKVNPPEAIQLESAVSGISSDCDALLNKIYRALHGSVYYSGKD